MQEQFASVTGRSSARSDRRSGCRNSDRTVGVRDV